MLVLFTDTDTDITPQIAQKYGYHLISMPYTLDGKTVYPYVDFDRFDEKQFYNRLREGALPTTSAVNSEEYKELFEPIFAKGDDIFYVHFSPAMSTTFHNMDMALEELHEKYPERKLYRLDTRAISIGSLGIIEQVGELFQAGKTVEEVLEWAKTEVDHYACYYFADDLSFFRRSGRVSGIAATMGNILGVRPIIYMGADGKMVSIGKERGRVKAMERLLTYMEELGDHIEDYRVYISHADSPELADQFTQMLTERFGNNLNIVRLLVNPTAGCHCGPSSMGVAFHATRR